jgi:hydrogenase/urease accessory protein HupE
MSHLRKKKNKPRTSNLSKGRGVFGWFFLALIVFPSLAHAHVLKLSSSEMSFQGSQVSWVIKVHLTDYNQKFVQATDDQVKQFLPTRVSIDRGGAACALKQIDLNKDPSQETVTIPLLFDCPNDSQNLHVSYGVFYGDLNHKHLLKLIRNGEISTFTFSPDDSEVDFKAPSLWKVFVNFLKLGLEHILTGYDHILFVLSLILGARRFKMLFWLVTAFTFAHSLSLALAVLNVVTLSPRFVEPAIAASIAFVATRHFLAREDQDFKADVLVTFFFGLIHGLGFSSALKGANLQGGQVLLPLLSFNLGVESGQVMIVALVFPLLQFFERLMRGRYLYLKRGALVVIAVVGIFWMVQRIWFPL